MGKRAEATPKPNPKPVRIVAAGYDWILSEVVGLLESARRTSARAVNAVMTATYWQVGRRIVEWEQGGAGRARYGIGLVERPAGDLTARFGRGFGYVNLTQMRKFYLLWPPDRILQTTSEESAVGRPRPSSDAF